MQRLAILILATGAVMLSPGGASRPGSGGEPQRTDVLAEFPMAKDPQLLTVPVVFRGQTYRFVIDTGASWLIYDRSFEDQLGAPVGAGDAVTTSRPLAVKYYNAPAATLGPLTLQTPEHVTCADLRFLDPLGIGRIHGIIGMAFLRKYALTLDVSHRKIQFRHEAPCDEAGALPLHFDASGTPLVEVVMPGEPPRPYELDTGTASSVAVGLDRATFDRLIARQEIYGVATRRQANPSGEHDARSGAAYGAMFAGVRLQDLAVNETPAGDSRVGMGAIRRMNLVLDFPRRRMTAERAPFWWW